MPDEAEFCERLVTEESYLQSIVEGGEIEDPRYPIRREMCRVDYQNKHNSFMHIGKERRVDKLREFVEFCRYERQQCRDKLDAIGKDLEFDDRDDDDDAEYPDPPTYIMSPSSKRPWHHHGHWPDSVQDKLRPGPPPAG